MRSSVRSVRRKRRWSERSAERGGAPGRRLALIAALPVPEAPAGRAEMAAGLRTTGHVLDPVLAPTPGERPLPPARARLAGRFVG